MCFGIPGKIVEIYQADGRRMGKVDLGEIKEACLDLVPEAKVGDYGLIHVGFALNVLDEQEAMATLDLFRQMDELAQEVEMAEFPSAELRTDRTDWARSGDARAGIKYVDEYRDASAVRRVLDDIHLNIKGSWTIMEICGGQTHNLVRFGIDEMLPSEIKLMHGPGCPVCVTPLELIDKAIALAARPDVIFTSYDDMLRVPGSREDLFAVKARGGQVRIVCSPLDAVKLAKDNPDKTVVFFAIGFETTAPANAMAVIQARELGLENFAVLVSHVTVPPAITAILAAPRNRVQGLLAPGHVCTVMGYWEYEPLAERFKTPIVVTGFEPLDLVEGIRHCVLQLEAGKHQVVNAYVRSVRREGNQTAQGVIRRVFEPCDRAWRGIGVIPMSGYRLREEFADMDAERRFPQVQIVQVQENPVCISGQVLQGQKKPPECPAFGKQCTPQHPLGATMASSEGACAAYFEHKAQRSIPTEEMA